MESERKTDKQSTCFKMVTDMSEWYPDSMVGVLPPFVPVALADAPTKEGSNNYIVAIVAPKLRMVSNHEEKHNALIAFFKVLQLDELSVSQLKDIGFVQV